MQRWVKQLTATVLAATLMAGPLAAPTVVGVVTHFGQGGRDIPRTIQQIKDGGFASIRDEVYWGHVERQKDVLNMPDEVVTALKAAHRENIRILLVLGYGANPYGPRKKPFDAATMAGYKRYVDYVSRELKGVVWGYEIWNEWDWKAGGYNPGTPESYMDVVKEVAPVIRKNCPECVVIGGGVTYKGMQKDWHIKVLKLGLLDHVDGISLHPYVESFAKPNNIPRGLVKWMDKIQAESRKALGGKPVPTYITEIGWSEAKGYSKAEVADFVEETIDQLSSRDYIKGLWWYELQDSGLSRRNGEHSYGLVDYFGQQKPSFKRFSERMKRHRAAP